MNRFDAAKYLYDKTVEAGLADPTWTGVYGLVDAVLVRHTSTASR